MSLLPLTLKAKGAAANFALMRHASETAGAALRREEVEEQAAAAALAREEAERGSKVGGDKQGGGAAPPAASADAASKSQSRHGARTTSARRRWSLARGYYALLRRQHGTPSMWWYNLNVFAQVNVFVSMSAALRQMAGSAWPGLSSEGALWFPDLTVGSVVLGSWATPLGVSGLFLPLGALAAYMASVDRAAPAAQSVAARALLELGALPVFGAACLVPQATLLYWLPSSVFHLLVQRGLDSRPALAARLGVPLLALRPSGPGALDEARRVAAARGAALVEGAGGGGGGVGAGGEGDGEFLRFLASDRLARGDAGGALLALERLTSDAVAPRDAEAWRARGALAARLGRWAEAARAFERAERELAAAAQAQAAAAASASASLSSTAAGASAPLAAPGGARRAQMALAPPEEAARLGRALLVRAGTAHLNAITQLSPPPPVVGAGGGDGGGAESSTADAPAAPTLSPEQRRHLDAALAALNRATSGLAAPESDAGAAGAEAATAGAEAAFDAWQALGTARVLARQWRPAGDAASRAWQALSTCSSASSSPGVSGAEERVRQRARQLLPLLRRVVGHLAGDGAEGGAGAAAAAAGSSAAGAAAAAAGEAGAAQRLASAARAAAGAAALAGGEGREAARQLSADLLRAAGVVRAAGGAGTGAEQQLAAAEAAARAMAEAAAAASSDGGDGA